MIRAVIFDMYETLITHYRCPLYFSAEMAAEAGLPAADFQRLWHATEEARTTGRLTLEDALADILRANGRCTPDLVQTIVRRRTAVKEECFRHLHEGILPMLSALGGGAPKAGRDHLPPVHGASWRIAGGMPVRGRRRQP